MSSPASTDRALTPGLDPLVERLGHGFSDHSLLELALTHRSWVAEHPGSESNERLEFLGDAVLGLAVTDELYRRFPAQPEGELAKVRAAVVNSAALAEVAESLQLGDFLRLGRGEHASGGRDKTSILADAMEAVIGAVFLDGGPRAGHDLVLELFAERIVTSAEAGPGADDYKTRLQERVAQAGYEPPRYDITETGPDHEKQFSARVVIDGHAHGQGAGSSKKQAEQAAAEQAWRALVADRVGAAPTSPRDQKDTPHA